MELSSKHFHSGLAMAVTAIFFENQVWAQSAPPDLMQNNSIIHPDEPVPPEVRFCFSDSDLAALAIQNGVDVIVHHGKQPDLSGFTSIYSHTEQLDFFAVQPIDPRTVSREILAAILVGELTNWAEISGSDQKITVYQPTQDLKKDAIAAQLRRVGILMQVKSIERASYDGLAQALREDPGAFVMGLRSEAAWEENLSGVLRIVPVNQYGQTAFAMPIQIYVKNGKAAAKAAASELLSVVEARAKQDRMEYPLAEKLRGLAMVE